MIYFKTKEQMIEDLSEVDSIEFDSTHNWNTTSLEFIYNQVFSGYDFKIGEKESIAYRTFLIKVSRSLTTKYVIDVDTYKIVTESLENAKNAIDEIMVNRKQFCKNGLVVGE